MVTIAIAMVLAGSDIVSRGMNIIYHSSMKRSSTCVNSNNYRNVYIDSYEQRYNQSNDLF